MSLRETPKSTKPEKNIDAPRLGERTSACSLGFEQLLTWPMPRKTMEATFEQVLAGVSGCRPPKKVGQFSDGVR